MCIMGIHDYNIVLKRSNRSASQIFKVSTGQTVHCMVTQVQLSCSRPRALSQPAWLRETSGEARLFNDSDLWALSQLRTSNSASGGSAPLLGKKQPQNPALSPTVLPASTGFCKKCFYFQPSGLLVCMMHSAVGVLCLIFFNKDLLSLCLIRPLQAGCTDPVPQTQLVSWIQQGCKPLRPPLSQLLCRAMPLHMMTEQDVHGGTSLCKKNNFTHRFPMPLYIDHNLMVGAGGKGRGDPHTTQTRPPQSSMVQMPLISKQATNIETSSWPAPRT